ncbi:MAG: hypothetical protein IKC29_03800 [Clostridia bacterium]|nr:hypothetical protein [Clostridia bacterium]
MTKSTARNKMGRTKLIALLALMLALTIIFCFVPIQFGPITLALMILPTLILAQVCDFKISLFMGLMMGLINYIAWFTTKAANPIAPIFQNPLVCILPRVLIAVVAYWSRIGLEKLLLEKWLGINLKPEKAVVEEDDEEEAQLDKIDQVMTEEVVEDFAPQEEITATDDVIVDDEVEENELTDKEKKAKKAKEIAVRQVVHLVSTALGVITNTVFVAIFTLIFFNNTSLGGTIIDVKYILAWFSLNFGIEVVAFSLITPPIATAIRAAKLV